MFEPRLPAIRDRSAVTPTQQVEGYAPFMSTVPRGPEAKPQKSNKSLSPGPGAYEVTRPLVRPLIETLRKSNNNIIIKINEMGSAPFRDHIDRFRDVQRSSQSPGPGQYYTIDEDSLRDKPSQHPIIHNSMHRYRSKFKEMFDQERTETIPRQKVLKMTKKRLSESESQKSSIEHSHKSGKQKGPVWSKYAEKRFKEIVGEVKITTPGPGTYEYQEQEKPFERQPSSSFISSSVRSYFNNIYYETNQDAKAQLREVINFKSDRPGPGQYHPEIQSRPNPSKFQFFGSTEQRLMPKKSQEKDREIKEQKSSALTRLAERMIGSTSARGRESELKLDLRVGQTAPLASIHATSSLNTIDTTSLPKPPAKEKTRKSQSVRESHKPLPKPINMIFDRANLF